MGTLVLLYIIVAGYKICHYIGPDCIACSKLREQVSKKIETTNTKRLFEI